MALKTKENSRKVFNPALDFNHRRIGGGFIVSNDFGFYCLLKENEFEKFVSGKIDKKSPLYLELSAKGFIKQNLDFDAVFKKWKSKNSFIYSGPGLHIMVMTLRCNHKCVYCQAQAVGEKNRSADMSWPTAKKAVDMAFKSPNKNITIEFQGGEPLCNWEVLKKTIEYAVSKRKKSDKNLFLALVSNLSLMDEKKAEFLLKNEVSVCTSLDGPAEIHNKNRTLAGSNSHKITSEWIKYFNKKHDTQKDLAYRIFKPSALLTVSKHSLSSHKNIVDEYVKNGLESVFLRPLSPIGFAAKHWDKIGYSAPDFLKFYKQSLQYIIALNKKGVKIREKMAQMLLYKIFEFKDPGFLDLRCPCGATIGQIAYNYDGSIYTCDEGRMIGCEGDDFFKVGNLSDSSYEDLIKNAQTKGCAVTSNLENQPMCFRCAYKPWCGVCPAVNYELQKSPWGNMASNMRCAIFMGIFDIVFSMLSDKKNFEILKSWVLEGK